MESILSFPSLNPLNLLNSTSFNLPIDKMLGNKLNFKELEVKRLRRVKVETVQVITEKPEFVYKMKTFSAGLSLTGISKYDLFHGEFDIFLKDLEIDAKFVGTISTEGNYEYLTFQTAEISHNIKDYHMYSHKDKCNSRSAAFFTGLRNFEVFTFEKCYTSSKF